MKVSKHTATALTRRSFVKLAALGMGGLAVFPSLSVFEPIFPVGELLGRVNVGKIDIKARPDSESISVGTLYEDAVVSWLQEVVGRNATRTSQRWVETPQGFIWSPYLQPVRKLINPPIQTLPETSLGPGLWVEVSVPYVDLSLANPPVRSPGFQHRQNLGLPIRLYYSQVMWVDQLKKDESGQVWYRISDKYGSYGDLLWGPAEAFRLITPVEIAPIAPEITEKRVVVNIAYQTLACFERKAEVFYTRISSGALFNNTGDKVDSWVTPIGRFSIWRKLVALHMSGGTTGGGWDLPGIGFTSLFVGSGVAIHSTFWHNNFGVPMSRGCVNARPEDAKWVFRWTLPVVGIDPGDVTVTWPGGTTVEVKEA